MINEKWKTGKSDFLTELTLRPERDHNKTIAIVVHLLPCRLHWSSSILVNEIRSIISTTANEPSILPTRSESTIPTWLSKKPRNTGHVRHVIWWGWTSRLQRPSENKKHTWNQTVKCTLFHGDSLYLSCSCYESYLIGLEKTCPRLKGPSSRRATLSEPIFLTLLTKLGKFFTWDSKSWLG